MQRVRGRFSTTVNARHRTSSASTTRLTDGRRSSATSFIGNLGNLSLWTNTRASNRTSAGSNAEWSKDPNSKASNDPLGLGQESDVVAAPTQWLVVMGPRSSGKSTLIRQMKLAHDGSNVTEMLRFTREIHKVAIGLFKQVARLARESICNEEGKASADRLLAVRRRALITVEVASDVCLLWNCPEIEAAEDQLADAQARKACRHYVQRAEALAEPDYVPTALDLLHMPVPTLGQQETRIPSFPGGPLSVFEMANDARSSTSGALQTGASTDVSAPCFFLSSTYPIASSAARALPGLARPVYVTASGAVHALIW